MSDSSRSCAHRPRKLAFVLWRLEMQIGNGMFKPSVADDLRYLMDLAEARSADGSGAIKEGPEIALGDQPVSAEFGGAEVAVGTLAPEVLNAQP